jgi:UDP-N-acetylmuramoylalanine--D-glutamate ligase
MRRALVIGLGQAGASVARQLTRRGVEVVVLDDRPDDTARAVAAELGVEYLTGVDVATLVAACDVVTPSPGVPIGHAAIQAALGAGTPVWSEFELAAEWDDRPIVAVTGTNGKTTVVTLVTSMLQAAGRSVVAAGNNDLPLVDALDDASVELFVVEASSFRLQFTERFRPVAATWLNLAPDHLDWHPSVQSYAAAKARIWAAQRDGDVAIGNADDAAVLEHLAAARARRQTFAVANPADWRTSGGQLVAPGGDAVVRVDELPRRMPHDLSNALAAIATAAAAGAPLDACAAVLRSFSGLPHRVQLVRDAGGVRWYDDSKATTPASVVTAASAFESVVLIAGGRNKGLDLGDLGALAGRVHAVVAIGEAAPLVEKAFAGTGVSVLVAESMDAAVAAAASLARAGDAVLLSPGCASYDWYGNYAERGDDFARAVHALAAGA